MRFDVEKRRFFTKKLYELKSVTLVQRAYRSEYKNKKYPTKAVQISKYSPVTATRLRKKGYFCSMVARLGKEHLQVVNEAYFYLTESINKQNNRRETT